MKSDSLLSSFKYAIEGIKKACKAERNLKVHTLALVIGAELFNTSIEEVVNLLSPEIRIHAKYAKDIAAGAVLVNAFFAAVVGCIILIPKIISLF